MNGRATRGGRYHHGDLRTALIDTAVELLAEQGTQAFTMAEASRRLGVAASAPYRHFHDRDALLAAVAVHAAGLLSRRLADIASHQSATDRLATAAHVYVRFASEHRPLFSALTGSGLDKTRHGEIDIAAQPIHAAFTAPATELDPEHADRIASAIAATAHGHALLLLDNAFGTDEHACDRAADQAAATVRALIAGRKELTRAAP
ncbi:TetR/AcrR family transcriptional regulator [Nocardia sp. NEAU-G5]|uniref:TetR/AcrR family transcriptional regulator n=1 Tax=Nocardia albiluteola TaxID=2842303 RepID=A0ABS6B319_9NOCA|nr:TetR/AcrR family transcriptional regulator [Nocardia albiluteola]MBU3064698.1 TetR/AcrR family transcriptional regulator [Nocardia albiluteola]